ncbi:MAG: flagellar basal body rod protein FlgC, partial [Marivita sp.]|uniref:flagellar basal body rod protein FlgC n=1 Tax=Marivita sp. TaxID=2003365 RepID=UPI003EFACB56
MADFENALSIAASGMRAQAGRLRFTSENIANADTPGYRRKTSDFAQIMDSGRATGAVETGRMRLDSAELTRIQDPSHPLAGDDGSYDGSNVNLLLEIADAREAQRSYEANLRMFEQSRKMSSQLFELLR